MSEWTTDEQELFSRSWEKEVALDHALRYADLRARNNPQVLSTKDVVEVAEAFEAFLREESRKDKQPDLALVIENAVLNYFVRVLDGCEGELETPDLAKYIAQCIQSTQ